ncbi:hypothetical protein H4F99_03630 [Lysobacter sp. SG-8]|uniref:Glycine zipper 2TM domain-containing protein n=1 Tax=Marilutibacter penaei TaxID=2759900 RepID=A0A7W3U247_9GAMM|nr:hypothetical protein [Lysobacter penaei]MBB1087576.1 hypothetical protein [Lysobacter penaei]
MSRKFRLLPIIALLSLTACATMAGASIGGGIGSMSGHTGSGMMIGAGVGTMVEILDD